MLSIRNILSGIITMSVMIGLLSVAMMAPPEVDKEQHKCLALNIYHEARSESMQGQIAVAQVTLNRVEHDKWPSTICEVVYEPKQFSWTHTLSNHSTTEARAWSKARIIARDVMIGNVEDPTYGAVFYHANYVDPSWAEYVDLTKVIGNHLFYTWDGDWNADN